MHDYKRETVLYMQEQEEVSSLNLAYSHHSDLKKPVVKVWKNPFLPFYMLSNPSHIDSPEQPSQVEASAKRQNQTLHVRRTDFMDHYCKELPFDY